MIPLERFLELPAKEVAALVQASGQKVVAFPVNGTRRWFVLEHADKISGDFFSAYLDVSIQNHVHLCAMLFDHGIHTLLAPVFGRELMRRGDEYTKRVGMDGLVRTTTDRAYRDFFEQYNVRVRFYGDYYDVLKDTPFEYVLGALYEVMEATQRNTAHNLYFGVFADDAAETIARLSVEHYLAYNSIPDKNALIRAYYGEDLPPVSLFIGFDKFSVFDMPLLSNGEEDLYFSVSPSPYMTERQLRSILYDHLYLRRIPEPDYTQLSAEELDWLRTYYRARRDHALGVGKLKSNLWFPDIENAS
ncbi:MAG: diterpene synthase [Chloroflexota bacterium]|nr:diterpene synthase [Chloroflexota bacterium]MBI5702501.1 diterpene synthase [Chloroflexota bacterium]